jgi:hypothetical protein
VRSGFGGDYAFEGMSEAPRLQVGRKSGEKAGERTGFLRALRLMGINYGGDSAFEGMEEGKLKPMGPGTERAGRTGSILSRIFGPTTGSMAGPQESGIRFNEKLGSTGRFQITDITKARVAESQAKLRGADTPGIRATAKTGQMINAQAAIKILDVLEGKTPPAGRDPLDRPGRRGTIRERIEGAKARQVNRLLSKLPGRIRGWIGTAERPGVLSSLVKANGRGLHTLPGPFQKWANWAFAGVIMWMLMQATFRYISGEYGRKVSGDSSLTGWAALNEGHGEYAKQMANIVAIVGSAVFIWKMLEVILNIVVNVAQALIAPVLVASGPVGWVIQFAIFAGKFYLTGKILQYLMDNYGMQFDTAYVGTPKLTDADMKKAALQADQKFYDKFVKGTGSQLEVEDIENLTAGQRLALQKRSRWLAQNQAASKVEGGLGAGMSSGYQPRIGTGVSKNWDFVGGKFPKQGTRGFNAAAGGNYLSSQSVKKNNMFRQAAIAQLKTQHSGLLSKFLEAQKGGYLGAAWAGSDQTWGQHFITQMAAIQMTIDKLSTVVAALPTKTDALAGGANTSAAVSVEGDNFTIINQRDPKLARDWPLGRPNEGIPY